jgi:hypothetical protein
MAHDFRCPERRPTFLLPPDMRGWLPEDDIVHLILDAVSLMDLAAFEAAHKLGGYASTAILRLQEVRSASMRLPLAVSHPLQAMQHLVASPAPGLRPAAARRWRRGSPRP